MILLSGTKVSAKIRKQLAQESAEFLKSRRRAPGLAVVIVGEDPASHVYVKNKIKACEEVGVRSFHHHLPATVSEAEVLERIQSLTDNPEVDGMLVQLPLPKHLSSERILATISPLKDADALTIENQGLLFAGRPRVKPCTPQESLKFSNITTFRLRGQNAVVVGRSAIVGRPMAQLLLMEDATVTCAHSKTRDLRDITSRADIVVVAAGKPRFLGADDFKKDSVIIDVGIHRLFDGLCGDVRFEELRAFARAATPVPGGVGPMTITMLLKNTLQLAHLRKN